MREIAGREGPRFRNTVLRSLGGWRAAWATEKSLRQWTGVNLASAALGLLVLAAELFDTAIENAADDISEKTDPRAKRIEDRGGAAVAMTAPAGGVAWAVVVAG